MLSNQILGSRVAAALVVASMLLSGCSWLHSRRESAAPVAATSTASADTQSAQQAEELTATEAALRNAPAQVEPAPATTESILKPNAPKSYTVKRGDTLWGIASLFLRDPWLWPEVWYINPKVANPHLIYPGDVLALAYGTDGQPQGVRLVEGGAARLDPRLRRSPLEAAIPTIPYT